MSSKRGLFALALPYVIATSLQYQFTKNGLGYADPFVFMGLRYILASAICFAIAKRFNPILNRDTILLSVFTFFSSVLWATGLVYVSPGQSAVLSYTMPLFAIPLSYLILKEGTSKLGILGALIGFGGVATYGLALSSAGGSSLGIVVSVISAAFWGLYTVYYRKLRSQEPVTTVATQFLIGGLLFLPLFPFGFHLDAAPVFFVDLGYVTAIGGVFNLLLWNSMARIESVGKITTIAFAVPATTVAIQALLTGEIPTPVEVAGVAAMFIGIYISRLNPGRIVIPPPERVGESEGA